MTTTRRATRRDPSARSVWQRVAGILGVVAIGISGILAVNVATAGADGGPLGGFAPSGANSYTGFGPLNPECPNGLAGTPGSDPANKKIDTTAANDFTPGGTVHYVYQDNPNFHDSNFTIQDCVVVYPAGHFDPADVDATTGVVSNVTKQQLTKAGTQIDGIAISGVLDSTGSVTYQWTSPATLTAGQWVCNFARDISTGHGGGGNRKVSPTCYQVPKKAAALTTTAHTGITAGSTAWDVAHLTGVTNDASGTITFNLFGAGDTTCSAAAIFTTTTPVNGPGDYTSSAHLLGTAGVYRWTASYSGDAANASAAHPCNSPNETTTVNAPGAVSISVDKTNNADRNATFTDSEIAAAAGADVAFKVVITNTSTTDAVVIDSITDAWSGHPASAVTCDPAVALPFTLAKDASVTCTFTITGYSPAAGHSLVNTVEVNAHKDGDAATTATASDTSTVATPKATPTLTTTATATATAGAAISDTAHLTGGTTAPAIGGSITFNVYGDNTCSGASLFTSTVPVAGNGDYVSGAYTTPAGTSATYYWVATYSGDAANNAITNTPCTAPGEQSVVTAPPVIVDITTTTTSTTAPPTTTTEPPTSTTVGAPAVVETTTTTAGGAELGLTVTAPSTTPTTASTVTTRGPGSQLPFTGSSDSGPMTLSALALLATGGFLLAFSRRKRTA